MLKVRSMLYVLTSFQTWLQTAMCGYLWTLIQPFRIYPLTTSLVGLSMSSFGPGSIGQAWPEIAYLPALIVSCQHYYHGPRLVKDEFWKMSMVPLMVLSYSHKDNHDFYQHMSNPTKVLALWHTVSSSSSVVLGLSKVFASSKIIFLIPFLYP